MPQPASHPSPLLASLGTTIPEQYRRTIELLTRLQSITAALASAASLADVGKSIIEEAMPALDAVIGVVAVLEPDGKTLTNVQFQGVGEKTQDSWRSYPIDSPVPVAEAVLRQAPVLVPTLQERNLRYPALAAVHGIEHGGGVVAYPLLHGGRILGSLGFCFAADRTLDDFEQSYLQTIAQQCAAAVTRILDDKVRKESERQLQESQNVLSLAMRGGRMGAWSRDLKTNKVWWSRELEEIFGLRSHGFGGSEASFFELVHPEDQHLVAAAVEAAIASGGDYEIVFRFQHSSGEWRWMEGRGRAIYDPSGRPTVLYGLGIDIHARKQAEDALRASQTQLQLISDTAPVYIASCDCEHRFKFSNRAYAERLGLRPQDLVGRTMREILGEPGYALVLPYVERVLRGESVEYTVEIPYPGVGRKWVECRYAPERNDRGEVQGWVAVICDVTDQRRAVEALSSRERELSLIYRNVSDVIFLLAVQAAAEPSRPPRFRFVSVNRAFLAATGLQESDVVGKPVDEVIPEPSFSLVVRKYQQAIAERATVSWEETTPYPSGTKVGTVVVTPLFDSQGVCTNLVGAVHDVTEIKRAEQALREADRRKDEFLAMLAHELRNPLGPIRNGVSLLRKMGDDRRALSRIQDMIERQSTHMARIVDDLLDVSRITRGKILLQREALDLDELVRATAHDYATQFQQKGVALTVVTQEIPVYVLGDRTRITQSIGNLLHNAQKFTYSGGTTQVTLTDDGQEATITVADSGIGMDAVTLERLFVPFAQADNSLERSTGGLGLGLSLVQGLIKLHGGSVTADSAGIGRGSTLRIRLPLILVDPPAAVRAEQASQKTMQKILIIEDNADAAESLQLLLSLSGHAVDVASSGPAALKLLETESPDIIICDIGLPGGMSGYEVAKAVRACERFSRTFMVALTGYGQPDDQRAALAAGFDVHLTKPVDPDKLESLLNATRNPTPR